MAKCQLSGKKRVVAHKVSHSNIKTNRVKFPNVQKRLVFDPVTKRTITLKLTTRALRTLDKIGLQKYLKKYGAADPKVLKALGL